MTEERTPDPTIEDVPEGEEPEDADTPEPENDPVEDGEAEPDAGNPPADEVTKP